MQFVQREALLAVLLWRDAAKRLQGQCMNALGSTPRTSLMRAMVNGIMAARRALSSTLCRTKCVPHLPSCSSTCRHDRRDDGELRAHQKYDTHECIARLIYSDVPPRIERYLLSDTPRWRLGPSTCRGDRDIPRRSRANPDSSAELCLGDPGALEERRALLVHGVVANVEQVGHWEDLRVWA